MRRNKYVTMGFVIKIKITFTVKNTVGGGRGVKVPYMYRLASLLHSIFLKDLLKSLLKMV